MLNIQINRFYFILLSIVVIFIDQLTKYLISLDYRSLINKELVFFTIKNVKNYGAAFNIFSGSRTFLSLVSIVITLCLIYIILNKKNIYKINLFSYSLILGGTIGNGIDRITKGYVIDFIDLNFIDFPVFNIADISINIGFFIIIFSFIKYKR